MTISIGARHYSPSINWNNQLDQFIVALAKAGFSASEISKRIYEAYQLTASRNAVIGRLTRLKFKRNERPKIVKPYERKKVKPDVSSLPAQVKFPHAEEKPETHNASFISLMEAPDNICRFVIGDPREFHVCSSIAKHGSYCDEHARVAFAPGKLAHSQGATA